MENISLDKTMPKTNSDGKYSAMVGVLCTGFEEVLKNKAPFVRYTLGAILNAYKIFHQECGC